MCHLAHCQSPSGALALCGSSSVTATSHRCKRSRNKTIANQDRGVLWGNTWSAVYKQIVLSGLEGEFGSVSVCLRFIRLDITKIRLSDQVCTSQKIYTKAGVILQVLCIQFERYMTSCLIVGVPFQLLKAFSLRVQKLCVSFKLEQYECTTSGGNILAVFQK